MLSSEFFLQDLFAKQNKKTKNVWFATLAVNNSTQNFWKTMLLPFFKEFWLS